jgi:hypothetical protein
VIVSKRIEPSNPLNAARDTPNSSCDPFLKERWLAYFLAEKPDFSDTHSL